MAILLTGTGSINNRWGKLLAELNKVNTWRSTTLDTDVNTILSEYLSNEQIVVSGLLNDAVAYESSASQWCNTLSTDAQNTIIAQAERDTPLPALTLNNALALLARQMTASGDSYRAPTVSATPAEGVNNSGSAKIGATTLDTDGQQCNFVFPEIVNGFVTASSGAGGTAFQEPVTLLGEAGASNPLDPDWPSGSSCSSSLSINNAAINGILINSNFTNWTGLLLDDWVTNVGNTATIVKGLTPVRGTFNLQFVGDGAQLTSIYQTQATALTPNVIYGVSFWAKRSAGAAAGVLRLRLADGSNTTLLDDAGTSNLTLVNVTSLTTSYQNYIAFFVTPKLLPSTTRFFIELTTGVTASETVDISLVGMVQATRLYTAGPSVAIFSGELPSATGDSFTVTVANNGGTTRFIPALNRFLNLTSLQFKLPTSVSAWTIPDSLITI